MHMTLCSHCYTSALQPTSGCGNRKGQAQHLSALAARPSARRTRHGMSTKAFAGAAAAAFPGSYDPGLGNVASAVGLVLAGVLAWRLTLEEQMGSREDTVECATCGGTGLEDCACTRWSDGDVGCSTCHGTGKSVCRSCHGGGTAVPIAAKVVKRNINKYDMGSTNC